MAIRRRLSEIPIRDIRDVETMATFDAAAREKLRIAEEVADVFIITVFGAENADVLESRLVSLAIDVDRFLQSVQGESLTDRVSYSAAELAVGLQNGVSRKLFHWPLQFPEAFSGGRGGFDAMVCNPPWGGRFTESQTAYLKRTFTRSNYKLINSFKFFVERLADLTSGTGVFSFLVPSSILEHIGCRDTRELLLARSPTLVVDCGDGMFRSVTQTCCFCVVAQTRPSDSHSVSVERWSADRKSGTARSVISRKLNLSAISAHKNRVFSISGNQQENDVRVGRLSDYADVFDSGIDYSRAALGEDVFYVSDEPAGLDDHAVLREEMSHPSVWPTMAFGYARNGEKSKNVTDESTLRAD